ncbi:anti-sigma regulatory factor [Mycolicibacterium murale]|uniref:Anti-sigma regulatory factor n=1 Tax=Mycolicibacterium murale TaxID=182220 RepID=A0A7I9WDQ3_9MYCO|nr:ATP-binding protein [Mycolicibacterium murale]MCV7180566.1 ATP-binding protein [Mycolicibacterium murale]GFG55865.1 anti-sigma regulatory factor [Mycolicibacterium murale]
MNTPAQLLTAPGELAQITWTDAATATAAAAVRDRLGVWLDSRGVSTLQISDIMLAVNEALANCVEHAYTNHAVAGSMSIQADHDPTVGSLSICITDHGTWRTPQPCLPRDTRGRGITLMHALADHCTINGRPVGTTVCLDYRIH